MEKEAGNFCVTGQSLDSPNLAPAFKGLEVKVQLPHSLPVLLQSGNTFCLLFVLLPAGLLWVQTESCSEDFDSPVQKGALCTAININELFPYLPNVI